jgi:hypothetical protein
MKETGLKCTVIILKICTPATAFCPISKIKYPISFDHKISINKGNKEH